MYAYDQTYLDEFMERLGAMLDFAVNGCGQDLETFYNRFLVSGIASQIALGNPKYLCGLSGIELAMAVAQRTGEPLPYEGQLIDMGSLEYWAGWTMAYIQWSLNMPFATLQENGVGIIDLYSRYPALHEADITKSLSFARQALSHMRNPLKAARKNAGLSQEALAGMAGLPLRTLRSYEQGSVPLANASAASIAALSRILGCRLV